MAKITAQLLYDHISDHSSHLSVEENTTPVRSRNCTQRAAASKVNIEPGRCFPLGQQSAAAVDNNRYHDTAADSRHELQQQGCGGMPGSHNVGSITGAHLPSPPHQPGAGAGWGAADYIRLLNITTAKLLAVLTVCLLAGYHALLAATHGVSSQYCLLPSSGLYCHTCRSPPARDC